MLGDLSPFALIMLGFVAGWIVEWLIDLGLRRKRMADQVTQREQRPQGQEGAPVAVEAQPAAGGEATAASAMPADSPAPVVTPPTPGIEQGDDLASIPGVGPAYACLLRERGVLTYEDLARLDEPDLRTLIRARPSWEKVDVGAWIAEARKRTQERQAVTAAADVLGQTDAAFTSASTAERAQDDGATQE